MRDKVILGITLSVVLLLTLLIYMGVEAQRGPTTREDARAESTSNGRHLFAKYCIQCHGPKGEGCVGPALNRDTWRAEKDGGVNPVFDPESRTLIYETIERGRAANQPGIQMPAQGQVKGGPLNGQEINDLIAFIQYGDWDTTLDQADSAVGLDKDLPTYQNTGYKGDYAKVKQIMLAKGCLTCHMIGSVGGRIGAPLEQVGARRTAEWLHKWIKNPSAVPASERGPNLWLVAATPGLYTPEPSLSPTVAPLGYPMNTTYMPTIPMTDDELNTLVDYLSHARTTK